MSAAAAPRAGGSRVAGDVAEPVHDLALRRRLDRGRHLVDAHGLPLPHQLGGVLAGPQPRLGGAGARRPGTSEPAVARGGGAGWRRA